MFRGLLQAIDGYLRARGKAITGVLTRLIATVILIGVSLGLPGWLHGWQLPASYAIPIGLSLALGFCFAVMAAVVLFDVVGHHSRKSLEQL